MFSTPDFDDLAAKLSALLAKSPVADLEKNTRALLSDFLSRMNLVTREEFEVQEALLVRSRLKLEELETRIIALEKRLPTDSVTTE